MVYFWEACLTERTLPRTGGVSFLLYSPKRKEWEQNREGYQSKNGALGCSSEPSAHVKKGTGRKGQGQNRTENAVRGSTEKGRKTRKGDTWLRHVKPITAQHPWPFSRVLRLTALASVPCGFLILPLPSISMAVLSHFDRVTILLPLHSFFPLLLLLLLLHNEVNIFPFRTTSLQLEGTGAPNSANDHSECAE